MSKFEFLTSVRFWKLGVVAISHFAALQGWIPMEIANAIGIWLLGSVAVATVDKASGN